MEMVCLWIAIIFFGFFILYLTISKFNIYLALGFVISIAFLNFFLSLPLKVVEKEYITATTEFKVNSKTIGDRILKFQEPKNIVIIKKRRKFNFTTYYDYIIEDSTKIKGKEKWIKKNY